MFVPGVAVKATPSFLHRFLRDSDGVGEEQPKEGAHWPKHVVVVTE
jgi:hypothetical protein